MAANALRFVLPRARHCNAGKSQLLNDWTVGQPSGLVLMLKLSSLEKRA